MNKGLLHKSKEIGQLYGSCSFISKKSYYNCFSLGYLKNHHKIKNIELYSCHSQRSSYNFLENINFHKQVDQHILRDFVFQ